jgi:hypothetical protein
MLDALRNAWNSLPPAMRTIINVALGAAFTALTQYAVTLAAPGDFDPSTAVNVLWVAVSTAVVRALNPLDTGTPAYGIGGGEADSPTPPSDGDTSGEETVLDPEQTP